MSKRSLGPADFVFAFTLVIRLIALARLTSSPFLLPTRGDMYFYNDWAQRILQGQWSDQHAFYGLPLYAYLLAFLYKLFGYSPFVPGLLQAVLEAGTSALIYKIATQVFANENSAPSAWKWSGAKVIGVGAAVTWAFFVPAQAYSVILMPTTWLIFVFWFVVWELVKAQTAPGRWRAFLLGLLIGFTAMGIATILFIVPLVLVAIFLRPVSVNEGEQPSALIAKLAAVFLLAVGLGLGTSPCWLHNYLIAHDRVTLSAHSGINFWIGNNPIANGYPRFPPGLRAGQAAMLQDSIAVAEAAAGHPLKRSAVSAYWSAKASNFIRTNPGAWLRLVWRKVENFWSAFQYDDLSIITNLRAEGVILPGPRFGLIAALALPGMLLAYRRYRCSRWILAAVLLHMGSLLTVFVTERYRLAAAPGLLLFAAFGLWQFWRNCSLGEYRSAGIYLGALAAATLFVSQPQRDPALWALDAYNSGWQALDSENLALAQEKLELARAYVPDNAEINLALGNLWMARRDTARAELFYRATLAIEPEHKSALSNLGVLTLEENRAPEAVRLLRAALAVQANDAKTHYLLARALLATGDKNGAFTEAETALQLKPAQPEFAELRRRILENP